MLFGGGLIPTYLVIKDLNLLNTRWAMILPGAMGVYNMIVARTFFINTIPNELHEAVQIDGATDFQVLTRIVLPLSASIIAVLSLFYAVGHWNAFFSCYIYIDNPELWNLQVVLRNFIAYTKQLMESSGISDSIVEGQEAALMQDVLKICHHRLYQPAHHFALSLCAEAFCQRGYDRFVKRLIPRREPRFRFHIKLKEEIS